MNRLERLRLLLNQAQFNGFEFRRWFVANVHSSWPGSEQALTLLAGEGRFYTLLFSHEFAHAFWRPGSQIAFAVPAMSYSRVNGQGEVKQVNRKAFTRRTVKRDVWMYHLGQMAMADDPVAYLCKFLPVNDQVWLQGDLALPMAAQA